MKNKLRVYISNLKKERLEQLPIEDIKQQSVIIDIEIDPEYYIYNHYRKQARTNPNPKYTNIDLDYIYFSPEICGNFESTTLPKKRIEKIIETTLTDQEDKSLLNNIKINLKKMKLGDKQLIDSQASDEKLGDTNFSHASMFEIERSKNGYILKGRVCQWTPDKNSDWIQELASNAHQILPSNVIELVAEWNELLIQSKPDSIQVEKKTQLNRQMTTKIPKNLLDNHIGKQEIDPLEIKQVFGSLSNNVWIKKTETNPNKMEREELIDYLHEKSKNANTGIARVGYESMASELAHGKKIKYHEIDDIMEEN